MRLPSPLVVALAALDGIYGTGGGTTLDGLV
jgi:hypothetical protein